MSPDAIRQTIRESRGSLEACYERVLQLQPQNPPRGEVAVRFVISKTGDVCAAEVSRSEVKEPVLERCVRDAVASMRFPPPRGGGVVIVTYPFIFRAGVTRDGGAQEPADAGPEEASL